MRNTMMMSDLPLDLVEEILCRIPATSLKKLRSTCKLWNSLFNDGRFTRKHLDKAAKQFMILMLNEYRVFSIRFGFHRNIGVEFVTCERSLIDPRSSLNQFKIFQVSHCEGLLLCTNESDTRIVVWNPCTGQTREIIPHNNRHDCYALGSYQDNKSHGHSYKILSYRSGWIGYGYNNQDHAIYEINSNSWRSLDLNRGCQIEYTDYSVSLKGNTYRFASDEKEKQLGIFLLSFDYTTERFGRLCLPCQCPHYETLSLSVVREEKLSVLLQRENSSRTEIWVTNKIGETKVVSWSIVLALDFPPQLLTCYDLSFLVDEEKKVIIFCDKYLVNSELEGKNLVHIIGEDNKVRQVDFGLVECGPFLLNYVPSLTQI